MYKRARMPMYVGGIKNVPVAQLCRTEEGVYFSKYANQRGANSATSLLNTLLALLALLHT